MTVEGSMSFAKVIEEHLELKRRNATLDREMPLDRYKVDDPFGNHPLFKSEEQARIEETLTGTQPMVMEEDLVLAWPTETKTGPDAATSEDSLWGRSRDFDWGD
jgi:hypothetical protein